MNMMPLSKVLVVVLFAWAPASCLAQVETGAGAANKAHFAKSSGTPDDSMVLMRGGSIQMGIDAAEISRFEKIFGIADPQLFQDEVPKHQVTVDHFYIDKYLVTNKQFKGFTDANPAWQPGRVPPQLDNGNYLKHWTTPAALATKADHSNSERELVCRHGLLQLGWEATAIGSGVGICRSWWPGCDFSLGK
jgi:formylglycine-generating enzyme required for sulfatase activity